MIVEYPLVGQAYTERAADWDAQTCINFYLGFDPSGKRPTALLPTAGTQLLKTLPKSTAPVRQLYTDDKALFAVTGTTAFRLDRLMGVVPIGQLGSSSGFVSMTHNNTQLVTVDGSGGYVYGFDSGTWQPIKSEGFPRNPLMVGYLDGYFIAIEGDSNVFCLSALNDATQWSAGDFAIAQSAPGKLVGLATLRGQLLLFGEQATEIWFNAGAPDFPLRRDNNLRLDGGCAARGSIASGHDAVFWLARDRDGVGSVKSSNGGVPQTVSTPAVDYTIQRYGVVEDAIGFLFKEDGHLFYQITFPTEKATWLFDASMNAWSELRHSDGTQHVATCHAFFNNAHLVGDRRGASILTMSSDLMTNDGELIRRERTGTHLTDAANRVMRVDAFDLLLQSGVGSVQDAGKSPEIFLSFSSDGGHRFGNRHAMPIGGAGDFGRAVTWRRLGCGRDYVFRLETWEPIKTVLLGAQVNYSVAG